MSLESDLWKVCPHGLSRIDEVAATDMNRDIIVVRHCDLRVEI